MTFTYDGSLNTDVSWSAAAVVGTIHRVFDANFRITSETINGANSAAFSYDNDGLLTGAGALSLARDATNGLLTGTTLGSVTDTYGYNSFGETTTYSATFSATTLLLEQYTRDTLGRVAQKTETVDGLAHTYAYSYDTVGRLTDVTKDGTNTGHYTYDSNSNRLSATTSSGTTSGSYDNQDRLTQYGTTTYSYSANGELQSKTSGSSVTSYNYDSLDNLTSVTLPNGTSITYVLDGKNRRIGKKVGGTLVTGFLYADNLRILAQLDGNNNVVSRFVYGDKRNVPEYMVNGGVTYRIVSDQLGSPRVIVDSSTGVVAQRMDFDEFGNVINDSNPGFQPFGFAGGLYDRDTGLVRFGMRDYEPSSGRWTAKDPIRFMGGDSELYGYVFNDPVNGIDPTGRSGVLEGVFEGAEWGGSIGGPAGAVVGAVIGAAVGGWLLAKAIDRCRDRVKDRAEPQDLPKSEDECEAELEAGERECAENYPENDQWRRKICYQRVLENWVNCRAGRPFRQPLWPIN